VNLSKIIVTPEKAMKEIQWPEWQLELLFRLGATIFSLCNYINPKADYN
jgi:hypothetical protein